nr:ATP synthase F0 subunit 6 [Cylas formicarius]WGU49531.1 ATP synthase F0 subunit 6 [Cylas formicarius]WGU49544.1 ATP synthase F0 subunit 6 [Cylas formicarius]WGU49557.1 ATP synthase F0 subunit 6 [Cylas formicarius]WGU49570.1 ATP synthase F0 subunit 6 [Cylas formicarius]
MNLFSSFDPSTNLFNLNWLSIMLSLILLPSFFWFIPSRYNMSWIILTSSIHKELKILLPQNMKSSTLILLSIFIFIMLNNFMGLFPYIFTSTSHMPITLSLSLSLWLTFMIFGITFNTMNMLAHLVPMGAPALLLPFLVIVELISNLIRPMTLAIRLTANMIAGHLLLTLLGNMGQYMNFLTINVLIFIQILLLILESAVSLIQAYVFSILITLYASEIH